MILNEYFLLNKFRCEEMDDIADTLEMVIHERDKYVKLLFQPCGDTHHDANKCPYCKENLNGKT